MLCQTLSHTLKLAPHERPSTQPLTKNPQQLCYFLCQTLTKDPQQVWQTLKNFDYPILHRTPFFEALTKKSPSWCVMLTLSRKGCKLNFYFGANFFIWTTKNEQNWLYAKEQKQKKNGNNAQFHYPSIQNIFLLPLWEPVLPLCAILRAKSR